VEVYKPLDADILGSKPIKLNSFGPANETVRRRD
jgi:hypothetical protein